jgi:hypothetical protein
MAGTASFAQVVFDNGPISDLIGQGAGGADVSSLHDGMGTYGAGHAVSSGFRIADDLVVAPNTTLQLDSLIFYAYQTGSGNISTITEVNLKIWNGIPDDPSSTIVFGDGVTNLLFTTEWIGSYRTGDFGSTTCDPATCTQRPIMRNALTIGTVLGPGTYWLDWQTNGSGTSGPWAPPVNLGAGLTTTGNAKQFDPTAVVWNDLFDGTLTTEAQGFPYQAIGTLTTGLTEIFNNNSVTMTPNPVKSSATVTINTPVSKSDVFTFTVYDVLGNVVRKTENISAQQFAFNRESLTNGVYMYEVAKGNTILKKGKVVLQ